MAQGQPASGGWAEAESEPMSFRFPNPVTAPGDTGAHLPNLSSTRWMGPGRGPGGGTAR